MGPAQSNDGHTQLEPDHIHFNMWLPDYGIYSIIGWFSECSMYANLVSPKRPQN